MPSHKLTSLNHTRTVLFSDSEVGQNCVDGSANCELRAVARTADYEAAASRGGYVTT